jgi:HB1, ASXL, restriction endonuclease HTH domain
MATKTKKATNEVKTPKATKAKKAPKAKPAKDKKPSALDAAARVLAESGQPMTAPALIEAMAAKGYWSSPNGQTPAATLYAAIIREIAKKGKEARFTKAGRGMFALAKTGA